VKNTFKTVKKRVNMAIQRILLAGTESVLELQTHMPNWFPPEKRILLGVAELVPVQLRTFSFSILQA
jgi:hypothetical protein